MKNYYYFHNPASLADTVDLGLPSGTLWAKCNLGAKKETDYGNYFMWGSTTPNTDTPCDWEHAPFNGGASRFDRDYFNVYKSEWLTKECKLKPEWLTKEGKLKSEYDAAHVMMGGDWRMPTKADFKELLRYTTNEWVTNYKDSGVNGRLFTSKANGKTVFFPAAGLRRGSTFDLRGDSGRVWSFYTDSPGNAWLLDFNSCSCDMHYFSCYYGFSVRGVQCNKK